MSSDLEKLIAFALQAVPGTAKQEYSDLDDTETKWFWGAQASVLLSIVLAFAVANRRTKPARQLEAK